MVSSSMPTSPARRTAAHFAFVLGMFTALYLISWPIVFSLDLWILKDRGSFLNLDYLLEKHFRLGVDTFYSYGLLPVSIQHSLFAVFGRGYWPLLGCAVVTAILIALFCAFLLRELPREFVWITALLVLSPVILIVNPNLPYSLVQLSLLFALLFVLRGRPEISFAIAAIGCWSVPSLSLVMMALLAAVLFLDWITQPPRSLVSLVRAFAPGILTYATIGGLLACEFGWRSVIATATPLAGMKFYKQLDYGSASALLEFLYPWRYHHSVLYAVYCLLSPVAWFVISTILLVVFALIATHRMVTHRTRDKKSTAILLCAFIQIIFICFAYGSPSQHSIFDPVLVVGVLLGLSMLPQRKMRKTLTVLWIGLGLAGQAILAHATLQDWKGVKSPALTANLYAAPAWAAEWKNILELSTHENLLLFSYGTGVHHYFPTIHSPEVWTLQEGQLLPADKAHVIQQLDSADVVVLDMTSPTYLMNMDPDIHQHLHSRCLTQSNSYFQIWLRRSSMPAGIQCLAGESR